MLSGNYFWQIDGIQRDELTGGGVQPVDIWNVNVGASAVIERGMLLGADSPLGEWSLVDSTADSLKTFGIARDNFTADDEHTVTQVYSSGTFNRERIILGGDSSLTLDTFENELRKQNIHLKHLEEKFGKVDY